jgi:NTE family protein
MAALAESARTGSTRIALALGGGSARGLAHIAMLEVFDELGVKPAIIAGTSMGAICGAAYASGLPARELRQLAMDLFARRARFLQRLAGKMRGGIGALWSARAPSVIDTVTLFEMLLPEIMSRDFATLEIPFLAIAADFLAMEQVVLDNGPLIPALAASSALPSLARPVVLGGRVLIDGGFVNPVPYDVVLGRADLTIAVDVTGTSRRQAGATLPRTMEAMTGATQILFRALLAEKLKSSAPHVLIRPAVGAFAAMDYFKIGAILGAADPAKEELKYKLSQLLE